jgi:pimeloyl-CoA synthetase
MKIPGNYNPYTSEKTTEHTPAGKEMLTALQQFKRIEEKNRCVRVRFLDWLSLKLIDWSKKTKEMAERIDNPCAIKLPQQKEMRPYWKEKVK